MYGGSLNPEPSKRPMSSTPGASRGASCPLAGACEDAGTVTAMKGTQKARGGSGSGRSHLDALDGLRDAPALAGDRDRRRAVREDVRRNGRVDGRREVRVDQR